MITGAGIDIGGATARAFAGAGYRVIVTDIFDDESSKVVEETGSGGGEAEYHHLDVTNTGEAGSAVPAVEERYGPLDAMVANTGIAPKVPLPEFTDERCVHTHEVDLKGVMRVSRDRSPHYMREVRRGAPSASSGRRTSLRRSPGRR